MREEEIKEIAREEMLDTIISKLNSSMIFIYINNLEKENKQLKEDKKKAIEYIETHQLVIELSSKKQISSWFDMFYRDLLEILGGKEQ